MNIRKTLAALVFSAALLSSASAAIPNDSEPEPPEPSEVELEPVNLTQLESQFNNNTDRIPGFVGSLIGDQTIAINLSNVEEDRGLLKEDIIGIKTEGKKISEIQWGEFNQTTLKIWIDQEDINQLMESEKPLQELKKMLKNEDIRYETYTLANKVKMTLMKVFLMF